MQKFVRIFSIILLVFLGISAMFGGVVLITDPSGKIMELPLSFLEHSPFNTFLIPGIILFLFNGVSSIVIMILVIIKNKFAPLLVFLQGVVQIMWIAVQIIIIRQTSYLQLIYGFTGIILLLSGLYLHKKLKLSGK